MKLKRAVLVITAVTVALLLLYWYDSTPTSRTDTAPIGSDNQLLLRGDDLSSFNTHEWLLPVVNYTTSQRSYCRLLNDTKYIISNYNLVEKLLKKFLPANGFDKGYRNFCWHSKLKLNMSAVFSLPELRRFYTSGQLTVDEARKKVQLMTSDGGKKKLTCLPSVFMAGFPKSGTTYIYNLLKFHPSISPGVVKEPHFWTNFPFRSRNPEYSTLGLLSYLANFNEGTKCSELNPNCLTIDASQSLLWDTRLTADGCAVPALIKEFLPDAKFIIIMRNPTDHSYSNFFSFSLEGCSRFLARKTVLSHLFDVRIKREIERLNLCLKFHNLSHCTHYTLSSSPDVSRGCGKMRLAASIYVTHIKKWFQFFSRDQFLFLRLEDIITDLYSSMQQMWTFIDVPYLSKEKFESIRLQVVRSAIHYQPMNSGTRQTLNEFFYPFNRELALLLDDKKFLWKD